MTVQRPRPRREWFLLRAVQIAAPLVPPTSRVDWQIEWEGELVYHFQRCPTLSLATCASLCYGMARDAIGLRLGGIEEWRHQLAGGWSAIVAHRGSACGVLVISSLVVAPLVAMLLVARVLIGALARSGRPDALALVAIVALLSALSVMGMLWGGTRALRVIGAPLVDVSATTRAMLLAAAAANSGALAAWGTHRLSGTVAALSVMQNAPLTASLALALTVALGTLHRRRATYVVFYLD